MDTSVTRADFTWKGPYHKPCRPEPPAHRDPILSDGAPTQMRKRKAKEYILLVDRRYIPPQKYQDDPDLFYPGHVEYMPSKCRVTVYQHEICKMKEAQRTQTCVQLPSEWRCRRESEYGYQFYCAELRRALFADPRQKPFRESKEMEELSDKMKKIMKVRTGDSEYGGEISRLGCVLMTQLYNR